LESLEQIRWMYNGYKINVGFTKFNSPNIDNPSDIPAVLDMLE
jgi:3-deoxy-manno-octulosonate cytidylyltransferase (CMP-KDO synthetase)